MKAKNLSLYIHIPFCIQKCKYCDFLSFSKSEEDRNSYIKELIKEIRCTSQKTTSYQVVSIFFGGGTPSILEGHQIMDIMEAIRECYVVRPDAEITIEANPGTVTEEKLRCFQKAGINRLSFGLQSTDNNELRMLGRFHDYETFEANYRMARSLGFDNINIDLMSALPFQTLSSYEKTLRTVLSLAPEHISAYSLIIEEGTPLAEDDLLLDALPDEDTDRDMYALTKSVLLEYGYERYEISNYAKPGYACRHNCVYWTGDDYIGFGLGASSYFEGVRYANVSDFCNYRADSPKVDVEPLSLEDQMAEFMFLGLRMTAGITADAFAKKFGWSLLEVYGKILEKHIREGLIIEEYGRYRLTDYGLDVSNYVFCDYLPD